MNILLFPGGSVSEHRQESLLRSLEHAMANDQQFEQLLMQATADDLRDIVRDLRTRLAGAEFAARVNHDTIQAMQRAAKRGEPR